MSFFRVIVLLTLAAPALGQGTVQNAAGLDSLADHLAHEIQLTSKHNSSNRVLVIGFRNQEGKLTAGSEHLAELLSDALASKLGSTEVVPRKQLREYLLSREIAPDLVQSTDVTIWSAEKVGANLLVSGNLSLSGRNRVRLQVAPRRCTRAAIPDAIARSAVRHNSRTSAQGRTASPSPDSCAPTRLVPRRQPCDPASKSAPLSPDR